MKSWAAIAAGPGRADQPHHAIPQAGKEQREPANQAASSPQDVLLAEALKSRPSVTGERRCLACGRAFHDLQRFAQHIKDAHGGVNAADAPPPPASTSRPGTGGSSAPRPSLRGAVHLGDVLLRTMPLPRPSSRGPSRQQLQPPPPQARQPRQAAQQQRTGSGGSAAAPGIAAGGPGSRAAPVVLAPPPGTRQRKQSKRESRLKRAFRRSQAVLACECWQSILGELEAALQGVSEAQGCLANQQASLAQQLAAAAGADAAAIDWASPQVALRQQDERQLARANLAVLQQLLEQQQRHAVECRARLERAHEHARIQLASAQQQLQKHERLPAPEPAPACAAAGADGGSAGGAAAQAFSLPADTDGTATSGAAAEAALLSKGAMAALPPAGSRADAAHADSLPSSALRLPRTEDTAAPEHHAQQEARQTSGAEDSQTSIAEAEEEGGAEARDAASEAASSSLASFGFQDVLSGWAASNRQLAALPRFAAGPAKTAHQAAARPAGASSSSPASGHGAMLVALPASTAPHSYGTQAPATALQGRPGPPAASAVAAQPSSSGLPAAQAAPAGCSSDAASDSSSGSESSSDGSFALQWGDQLLAWASTVKADAAAVARLATQGRLQQQDEAQQQQQQQQQQKLPASELLPHQSAPLLPQQQLAAPVPSAPALDAGSGLPSQPPLPLGRPLLKPHASPAASAPAEQQPAEQQRQQPATAEIQQQAAAPCVDVAAWLSSASEEAPPAGAAAVSTTQPSLLAAVDGDTASLLGSTAAASAGAAGGTGAVQGHMPEQQQRMGQQQPAYVRPAEGVVGAFRCLLCLVTVSGQRNLQEHLASKRHVRRVASQAAAAAQAAAGPEAAQALALAGTAGPAGPAADGSGRSSGGGAAGGGGRTYTGLGADVEPYVNQVITPELNALAEALLRRLLVWQERARLADPLNFKRKRRLVSGMREVEKAIKTRKAKLVLLAPNIASIVADPAAPEAAGGAGSQEAGTGSASGSGTGGAAAAECPAEALIALAAEKEVPLVFALSRQRMGKVMGQRKRASAFAVLDANGVFEELRRLLALAEEGRQAWAAAAAAARPAGAAAMNVGALP